MMDSLFADYQPKNALPFVLPDKAGYSARWNEQLCGYDITIPNGELFYAEHFFDKKISDRSVEYLLDHEAFTTQPVDWRSVDKEALSNVKFKNIVWNHDKINMYGKEVFLPRYSAWYGDSDKPYTYSGLTLQPKPWNKGLSFIKDKIEAVANTKFNSVLLNWYRDGEDYINWHTDAEKSLGKNPVIGSVNFGAARTFQLRRMNDNAEKMELQLKHGTFLLMRGETQHFWQHGVPKEKKVKQLRINLTFRIIM